MKNQPLHRCNICGDACLAHRYQVLSKHKREVSRVVYLCERCDLSPLPEEEEMVDDESPESV